jgi:hypothetical protein
MGRVRLSDSLGFAVDLCYSTFPGVASLIKYPVKGIKSEACEKVFAHDPIIRVVISAVRPGARAIASAHKPNAVLFRRQLDRVILPGSRFAAKAINDDSIREIRFSVGRATILGHLVAVCVKREPSEQTHWQRQKNDINQSGAFEPHLATQVAREKKTLNKKT